MRKVYQNRCQELLQPVKITGKIFLPSPLQVRVQSPK